MFCVCRILSDLDLNLSEEELLEIALKMSLEEN